MKIVARPVPDARVIVIAEEGKMHPFAHITTPTAAPQPLTEAEYDAARRLVACWNASDTHQSAAVTAADILAAAEAIEAAFPAKKPAGLLPKAGDPPSWVVYMHEAVRDAAWKSAAIEILRAMPEGPGTPLDSFASANVPMREAIEYPDCNDKMFYAWRTSDTYRWILDHPNGHHRHIAVALAALHADNQPPLKLTGNMIEIKPPSTLKFNPRS